MQRLPKKAILENDFIFQAAGFAISLRDGVIPGFDLEMPGLR